MILFINTTDREYSEIALITSNKVLKKKFKNSRRLSEQFPKELAKILKGTRPKAIAVVSGPGAFMGTRTGVTYANALGFAHNLPVLGLETGEVPANLKELLKEKYGKLVVTPKYGAPPNITTPRKRNLRY